MQETPTDLARIRSTPWVISRIESLSVLQTAVLASASPFLPPPARALFNPDRQTAAMETLRDPCLVFPNEQSTQPRSCPNVNVGCLISSAALPSNLSPCLRASTTNSFSAIDGEGGLISGGDRQKYGSPHHSQPSRLSCQRLHLEQLPPSA